ncbi:MAG TPA: DUF4062 domain-containing protein [Blastocatellia bacterium]|nr:DUF4062 domain-containing protein [Blastocatellia bacterium]
MLTKKVFLASTGKDLAECRRFVIQAITGLDGYQCICMENFGSRDAEADSFCREQVSKCDLFIGIVGHLYGDCPKGSDESYTYREYKEAKKRDVPRLMFVAAADFPIPAKLIQNARRRQKQRAFRREVEQEGIRQEFSSPTDLAIKAIQAIHNWHQKSLTDKAEQRLKRLAKLTQNYILNTKDLMRSFRHITEELAMTLAVERVSIWRYTEDRKAIECDDLYTLSTREHGPNIKLSISSAPRYFEALATSEVLDVKDARRDLRTSEFLDDYLLKYGIVSMMDVPIHLFGYLGGVICHEHVGELRKWTPDEITFAIAVANLVALAIEQYEQRDSEERYRKAISAMHDGIVLMDDNAIILDCNRSAGRILGRTVEEMLGLSSQDPEWRTVYEDGSPFPAEEHPVMVTLRTGKPCAGVILGVHKSDNTVVWISINTQPLFREGQNRPYAVVASFSDISNLKPRVDFNKSS